MSVLLLAGSATMLTSTAATATAAGTITLSGPSSALADTDVTVTATYLDGGGQPVVGEKVGISYGLPAPEAQRCVTGVDGSCSVVFQMSQTWQLYGSSDPAGPHPGVLSDSFTVFRKVPTTITLTQTYPQTPVEIGSGNYGVDVKVTETASGFGAPGPITLTRTDVVPNEVIHAMTDNGGGYYFSPIAAEGATWTATYDGFNEYWLPSSTSAPLVVENLVRTPLITMDGNGASKIINAGQTVTLTGKVTNYALNPVQGLTLELWSKASILAPAIKAGETVSAADGAVSLTITPHRSGDFEWRHVAGDGGYIAGVSAAKQRVAVKVTGIITLQTVPDTTYTYATAPANVSVKARLTDFWGDPLVGEKVWVTPGQIALNGVATDSDGVATMTFATPRNIPNTSGTYKVHYGGFSDDITTGPASDSAPFSITVTHTGALSNAAAPAAPYLGATFKVTGELTIDGVVPPVGAFATLWRKGGGSDWTQIGSSGSGGGLLSYTETALAGTYTYQWRFAAAYGIPAQVSNDVVVTANPLVPTKMVAAIEHRVLVTGASTTVGATFGRADGVPESSTHTFELWASVARGSWARLATLTTTSAQPYIGVRPTANTRYQWRYVHTVGPAASSSNIVSVTVVPTLSAYLSKSSVKHGKAVKFYGTVAPHRAGVKVYLMQGSKRLATTTTVAGGKYRFSVKFSTKGTRSLRAVIPSQTAVADAKSRLLKLKVT